MSKAYRCDYCDCLVDKVERQPIEIETEDENERHHKVIIMIQFGKSVGDYCTKCTNRLLTIAAEAKNGGKKNVIKTKKIVRSKRSTSGNSRSTKRTARNTA